MVLSKRLKHSALMVGSRMKSGREFRWGQALKRQCGDGSEVVQVADGWRNTDAAEWQHWRPGSSSPTVRWCAPVQTPMN